MLEKMKTILLLAVLACANPCWAQWDDPPHVNTVQATTGIVNLNFGMGGDRQQIGIFIVNSNDPAGFHVDFTFANKGMFKTGSRQFSMSGVVLSPMGGTLGSGLGVPSDYSLSVDGTTGIATWSPGGTPGSATVNYIVAIYADWADQSSLLAGFYQENISAVIVSGP